MPIYYFRSGNRRRKKAHTARTNETSARKVLQFGEKGIVEWTCTANRERFGGSWGERVPGGLG